MKTIYELNLHEPTTVNENVQVLRVPGGWLYTLPGKDPVFVELNYESRYDKESLPFESTNVVAAVRSYFKLPTDFIKEKNRDGNKSTAKFFIAKILYDECDLNHGQISEILNVGRSNVTQSISKINYRIDKNQGLRNQYNTILKSLSLR